MTKIKNKNVKHYLKDVKRNLKLVYPRKQVNEMLQNIESDIAAYIDDTNQIDMQDIEDRFGKPIDFIAEFINPEEIEKISSKINVHKYIKIGIAITLTIILISAIYFWALWYDGYLESKEQTITQETIVIE